MFVDCDGPVSHWTEYGATAGQKSDGAYASLLVREVGVHCAKFRNYPRAHRRTSRIPSALRSGGKRQWWTAGFCLNSTRVQPSLVRA